MKGARNHDAIYRDYILPDGYKPELENAVESGYSNIYLDERVAPYYYKMYKAAYEDLRKELGEEDNFLYAKHYIEFGQDENRVKGNKSYEEPKPAASQQTVTTPVAPDYDEPVCEYDANGNVIKETYYNEDGTVNCTYEYKYDEAGRVLEQKSYNASGVLVATLTNNWGEDGKLDSDKVVYKDGSFGITEYDDSGASIGFTQYYTDGSYTEYEKVDRDGEMAYLGVKTVNPDGSYTTSEWNDLGAISKQSSYDAQGNLIEYYEYKYNAEGNLIEHIWYDGDGSLILRGVNVLDENGELDYGIYYKPDGSYYFSQSTSNSNSWKYFDADGNFEYWEEEFYDENRNYISRVEYDENGNVIKEYLPTITEEGNVHWVLVEA